MQKNSTKKLLLAAVSSHRLARSRFGIASLPVVLLLGIIMVEIGIAGTLLLSYLNTSVYGVRLSNDAFAAARSGIDDAVLKIIYDKNCGSNIDCPSTPYTFSTPNASAEVTICASDCAGSPAIGVDQKRIISIGSALTKVKRLVALVTVSSTTGLVTIDSLTEIAE